MKYTRYDLKRKKDGSKILILILALIILLAIIIGTIIYKIISINTKTNSKSTSNNSTVIKNNSNSKTMKFIVVQGGMYAIKNNVSPEVDILKPYGTPFTIDQDSRTRVFLGIYNEQDGLNIMKTLTDKKVDNSKILFQISEADTCDAEIAEIVNADIEIIKKLSDSNVKAIKTSDFKKWVVDLKKVDNNSKHIKELNSLKDYIGKLPDEISKDKITENYTFMYNILQQTCK